MVLSWTYYLLLKFNIIDFNKPNKWCVICLQNTFKSTFKKMSAHGPFKSVLHVSNIHWISLNWIDPNYSSSFTRLLLAISNERKSISNDLFTWYCLAGLSISWNSINACTDATNNGITGSICDTCAVWPSKIVLTSTLEASGSRGTHWWKKSDQYSIKSVYMLV